MYAAAHPSTGESFWLSLPRLDGDVVRLFLDEFAKRHAAKGKQIILIWDAAPAHRANSLRVPERITLVPLPAYRPELNPAENLWPLVKEGVANDCFKNLGVLEKRVCARSRKVSEDRDLVSS
jgi:transposase